MSAPFQPGDCVVCVDDTTPPKNTCFPPIGSLVRCGSCYRVNETFGSPSGICVLSILGIEPWKFEHWRFRKIDEDVTESFREQMRSLGKQRADAE